jgi:hypothetical protein
MRIGLIGLLVTLAVIVFLSNGPTDPDLRSRLPEFQRIVDARRSISGAAQPIRIVVYAKDHTVFALSNSFEQVVYDETDDIDHNPDALSGFWPYPGSSTGKIDVGGRKSIDRIGGHFYHVWIASP